MIFRKAFLPQSSSNIRRFFKGVPAIRLSDIRWKYRRPLRTIFLSYLQKERVSNFKGYPETNSYVDLSQSATILRISTSDLCVSSNPGVSTNTRSPKAISGIENLTLLTLLVHDSRLCPTPVSRPVIIFMNWCYQCSAEIVILEYAKNVHCFFLSQLGPSG